MMMWSLMLRVSINLCCDLMLNSMLVLRMCAVVVVVVLIVIDPNVMTMAGLTNDDLNVNERHSIQSLDY